MCLILIESVMIVSQAHIVLCGYCLGCVAAATAQHSKGTACHTHITYATDSQVPPSHVGSHVGRAKRGTGPKYATLTTSPLVLS